jgi:hypothetical protein
MPGKSQKIHEGVREVTERIRARSRDRINREYP